MNRDPQANLSHLQLQSIVVDYSRFPRRRLLAVLKWAGAFLALAAGVYAWLWI